MYKPMLYSTPMVQATLANRKNQTRRTQGLEQINKSPDDFKLKSTFSIGDDVNVKDKKAVGFHAIFKNSQDHRKSVKAKYATGDIIWVRETFMNCNPMNFDNEKCFLYKSDFFANDLITWKPSIHMPKDAARIFLEVTNVRCERLHDISESDAVAEGVAKFNHGYGGSPQGIWWKDYLYGGGHDQESAKKSFIGLWKFINGKDSWKVNPWVWVYELKQIEKPTVWPS